MDPTDVGLTAPAGLNPQNRGLMQGAAPPAPARPGRPGLQQSQQYVQSPFANQSPFAERQQYAQSPIFPAGGSGVLPPSAGSTLPGRLRAGAGAVAGEQAPSSDPRNWLTREVKPSSYGYLAEKQDLAPPAAPTLRAAPMRYFRDHKALENSFLGHTSPPPDLLRHHFLKVGEPGSPLSGSPRNLAGMRKSPLMQAFPGGRCFISRF